MVTMINADSTSSTIFKLNGTGTNAMTLKNDSNVFKVRDVDDTVFREVRCLAGTDNNSAVTYQQFLTIRGNAIVPAGADCSAALPANTAAKRTLVVTVAGTGAVIGDLLYDNGTAVGNMEIIAAMEGRTILVTDAITGGTVSFKADTAYIWDADGTVWVEIPNANSGTIRAIAYPITTGATQDSTQTLDANARIYEVILIVSTPYSGGTTISIGYAGAVTAFMTTAENNPLVAGTNVKAYVDIASSGSAIAVRTTVGGAPGAGVGKVIVKYCVPNA